MKIKILTFSLYDKVEIWDGSMCSIRDSLAIPKIEEALNEFCKDKDIVDIKLNLSKYEESADFECNHIMLIYTILYK